MKRESFFLIIIFVFLDLLAVGFGMGVPFFPILLGFVVGWFLPSILWTSTLHIRQLLRRCLIAACITSGLTFLVMIIIWGPSTRMLFDPSADIKNFGIPMILYEPMASFIGWLVLMIFISPFLQALTTIFASSVRLAWFQPAAHREKTSLVEQEPLPDKTNTA